MRTLKSILVLLSIVALAISCQEKACKKPKSGNPINPNGDSELALLMREMFTESDSLRQLISEGKKISGLKRFREIHTANPTDSAVSGPLYTAFAKAYIQSIDKLETEDAATIFNFNNMVTQCMNCHTEFCPGPRKRIKKLYLNE